MDIEEIMKKVYIVALFIILFLFGMVLRFKLLQPESPTFRYNGSIFSVSNEVYEVDSEYDIFRALALGRGIDENSLKYFYRFNPRRELVDSYMVASFSEIYCINKKPLRGKLSDVVLVKFADWVEYKGLVYEKGKFYIANRTDK